MFQCLCNCCHRSLFWTKSPSEGWIWSYISSIYFIKLTFMNNLCWALEYRMSTIQLLSYSPSMLELILLKASILKYKWTNIFLITGQNITKWTFQRISFHKERRWEEIVSPFQNLTSLRLPVTHGSPWRWNKRTHSAGLGVVRYAFWSWLCHLGRRPWASPTGSWFQHL